MNHNHRELGRDVLIDILSGAEADPPAFLVRRGAALPNQKTIRMSP